MSTIKQRRAINNLVESRGNLGKAMIQAGYLPATAKNPKNLTDSKGFQELLAMIDDKEIVMKWLKWALEDKDKRVALQAGENIMKLKDRYPAGKLKLGAFEERDKVIE